MIHIGKNTRSTIVSKGISAGHGQNSYRGLVEIRRPPTNARNLLAVRLDADRREVRRAHLPLHRSARTRASSVEHEASTSKISEDQIFYCNAARHQRTKTRST
jgi:Fe-S cluster assembly protein SufB